MMKELKHVLLAALALAFLTMSCIDPLEPVPNGLDARIPDKALVFSPTILGSTVVTKAINTGDGDLGELAIEWLDVYVYKIISGSEENAVTEFFKRYHFITVIPEGETEETLAEKNVFVKTKAELASGNDIVLETDWRQAGYDQTGNQKYRIYSIANSRMTGADRWANLSETDLRTKTITSNQTHYRSYDIVRLKNSSGPDGNYDIHIKDKNFLMDGMIDGWTTSNLSQQYFTEKGDKSFPLTRAAAKFIVNVSFDPLFLEELDDEGTILERHVDDNNVYVSTTGAPRLKFSNFMPTTYEVSPTATPSGAWRDANSWSSNYNYDFPEYNFESLSNDPTADNYTGKATYTLTTYSYSFAWDNAQEGAICAPAIVLLINYKTEDEPAETFFYRIPLVDLSNVSSIERNYLYIVDATISSKGAIIEDIKPDDVVLKYQVLPWAFNAATDVTEVEGAELLYFTADTTYTLRGEQTQSVPLDYFTPKSELMSGHYLYEPMISNVRTYYVVSAGDTTNIVAKGSGTYSNANRTWVGTNNSVSGSRVTINVVPSVENDGGGGVVSISSVVLANRAVKHIEFDASVTFSVTDPNTGSTTQSTVTHHYHIVHFPLDNIQSIKGAWSSRWDGTPAGAVTTYFRKKFSRIVESPVEIDQVEWWRNIGNDNDPRKSANSRANAINGYYAEGEQYTTTETSSNSNSTPVVSNSSPSSIQWNFRVDYWGDITNNTVTITGTNPQGSRTRTFTIYAYDGSYWDGYYYYDYVSNYTTYGSGNSLRGRATLVKYEHYYHLEQTTQYSYNPVNDGWGEGSFAYNWEKCSEQDYNNTAEANRRKETVSVPGVANDWVDWDIAYNNGSFNGNTGTTCTDGDLSGTRTLSFSARYFGSDYGGNAYIYTISYSNGRYSGSQSELENNHMYVIQISKADNSVVLGHPKLDEYYQSNDNVVSPAFMIASQLGAIRSYTGGTYAGYSFDKARLAAVHCGTYMEVSTNGRRFVNWRLPTAAEVKYIVDYQKDPNISGAGIFEPVLTGSNYIILPGGNSESTGAYNTGYSGGGYFVRCVRDLSPAEVEELNRTGIITDATY